MSKKYAIIALTGIAAVLAAAPSSKAAVTAANNYKQGKVYKITPKSKPFKNKYVKAPTYNKKTRTYFTIRSYMEKFQKAKKGTLVLKKGTYKITNTIQVPSNVTIILEKGAKIVKSNQTGTKKMKAATTIFQLIKPSNREKSNVYGGHNGEKNIHFVGKGSNVMDLKYLKANIAIVMGHNKDITVSGITFQNVNTGHFIEMDASLNVTISKCKFKNVKSGSDYVKEAINIDTPDKETNGFNNIWSKHDKTPNENVTISGCQFTNLGRAIGTHKYSASGDTQIYHRNIQILNCKISNMRWDSPIRVMNWKDSAIQNTVIQNVKQPGKSDTRGVLVSGAVNFTMAENIFIGMGRPAQCIAWKNDGPGSAYPITYNDFTEQNLADMATNKGKKLTERYIRISPEYNVFEYAQIITIKKA